MQEKLELLFDAVVMLTWSDWESEPRSNRYHYASRFASHVPVIFLQNQKGKIDEIQGYKSEIPNLDIINVSAPITEAQVEEIKTLLHSRGFKCPLIWIYDFDNFTRLLDVLPRFLWVFHASEDYLNPELNSNSQNIQKNKLKSLLKRVDLVVCVSKKVLDNIKIIGKYSGKNLILQNGCDFSFYEKIKRGLKDASHARRPVAIFQGGVNSRLDFDLIYSIASTMTDFDFKFIGKITNPKDIKLIRGLTNVEFRGQVGVEELAVEMLQADVGIIPFKQLSLMYNSMPLKAMEYVACGLPVVSVPIFALENCVDQKDIFLIASDANEFAEKIRYAASIRHNSDRLIRGDVLAKSSSYDDYFITLNEKIHECMQSKLEQESSLNVAIFYDHASTHVGTLKEHLESFKRFSSNDITYIPATTSSGTGEEIDGIGPIDLSIFDVVIVHYSIRISLRHHLIQNFANSIKDFSGLKVLFIQDEYDSVECTRQWMDILRFDLVYTCVPLAEREKIYPSSRFPSTKFLSTLTGYVPELVYIDNFICKLEERKFSIVYRGRELPAIYGLLGREKYLIGEEVKKLATQAGLSIDISSDHDSRIYGDDWYRFLASGRATLGTESGSNIFDFDGSLAARIEYLVDKNPEATFEKIWQTILINHEGVVRMNQISPKIFEAIRLRTALVLFEGDYSGVVKPDIHFIPLRKDFSNFGEVVAKIMDDEFVLSMTQRAYDDVIKTGAYSYRKFIKGVDDDLRRYCLRRQERQQMFGAIYTKDVDGRLNQRLPIIPLGINCAGSDLSNRDSFEKINKMYAEVTKHQRQDNSELNRYGITAKLKISTLKISRILISHIYKLATHSSILRAILRPIYRKLPTKIILLLNKFI